MDEIDRLASRLMGQAFVCWYWVNPSKDPKKNGNGTLTILTSKGRFEIDLTGDQLPLVASFFWQKSETNFVGFDCKDFFCSVGHASIQQGWNPVRFVENNFYDLAYLERYLDNDKSPPATYAEAIKRFREVFSEKNWATRIKLHRNVHLPLATRVLPGIERVAFKNTETENAVRPYYQLERQSGGRLNCESLGPNFYVPHTMSDEVKNSLAVIGFDHEVVYADYRSLEFVVLAHLSGDPNLLEDSSKEDPYASAYTRLFQGGNPEQNRKLVKQVLLPVMYGMTPPGLAKSLDIGINLATEFHMEIQRAYPVAFSMLTTAEREAGHNNGYTDILGRHRRMAESGRAARNMSIQSPGAAFCQEHLVWVFDEVKAVTVAASIHDGFIFLCKKGQGLVAAEAIKTVMERPSTLIPDLSVHVKITWGNSLGKMEENVL